MTENFGAIATDSVHSPEPRHWLGHVELLRGVAVGLVLLFHFQIGGFKFGYLGVDVFFVISGFLMARLYGAMVGSTDYVTFYRRRMARLLPAYFVVLLVSILVSAALVLPNEFADVVRNAYWSALLLPNIGFWSYGGYFQPANFRPTLNLWSLGVEIQFYLLFPLLVLIGRRSVWLLVAIALASCALYFVMGSVSPKTAFFQLPCRLWQFMAGAFVARLAIRPHPGYLGAAALLALILLLLVAANTSPGSFVLATATVALTASFIALGLPRALENSALLHPVRVLGRYSYSIYLVHFPIIVLIAYQPFGGTSLALTGSQTAVALLLTSLAAFALYHLVEVPFKVASVRGPVIGATVVAALTTGFVAVALVPLNRALLPAPQLMAANAWFDRLGERCPIWGRITHPFDRSCLIAGSAGPGVLLVGDSHADVLKAQLGDAVEHAGGALRLMQTVYAVSNSSAAAQRRVAEQQGVDGRAIGALSPAAVIRETRTRNSDLIVVHSNPAHVDPAAIDELARRANHCGIAVAMIMPLPLHGYHVPKYIYTALQAGQQPQAHLTAAQYDARYRDLTVQMQALARDIPSFRVFFPHRYLCTPNCAIEDRLGHPLYSDSQHLTQTGVARLQPMFADIAALIATRAAVSGRRADPACQNWPGATPR